MNNVEHILFVIVSSKSINSTQRVYSFGLSLSRHCLKYMLMLEIITVYRLWSKFPLMNEKYKIIRFEIIGLFVNI